MEKEILEQIYDEENSVIKMLLEYQEQEEHMLDEKASNELRTIYKDRAKVEKNIKKLLNKNISNTNARREIINYIENLKQYFHNEVACLNENYYRVGFSTATKLIIECSKKQNS